MDAKRIGLILILAGISVMVSGGIYYPGQTIVEHEYPAGGEYKYDGMAITINNTHYENVETMHSQDGVLVIETNETPMWVDGMFLAVLLLTVFLPAIGAMLILHDEYQ